MPLLRAESGEKEAQVCLEATKDGCTPIAKAMVLPRSPGCVQLCAFVQMPRPVVPGLSTGFVGQGPGIIYIYIVYWNSSGIHPGIIREQFKGVGQ